MKGRGRQKKKKIGSELQGEKNPTEQRGDGVVRRRKPLPVGSEGTSPAADPAVLQPPASRVISQPCKFSLSCKV